MNYKNIAVTLLLPVLIGCEQPRVKCGIRKLPYESVYFKDHTKCVYDSNGTFDNAWKGDKWYPNSSTNKTKDLVEMKDECDKIKADYETCSDEIVR